MSRLLSVELRGRELTITGKFKVHKDNNGGDPLWILRLNSVYRDPEFAANNLRAEPTWNTDIGIIVLDYEFESTAKEAEEYLVDQEYADRVIDIKKPIKWGALSSVINEIKDPLILETLDEQYNKGGAKYGADNYKKAADSASEWMAKKLHTDKFMRDMEHARTVCDECGNSGFYEGFNVMREPCSQGCKAP